MDGASNTTLDYCAELADGSQILRMVPDNHGARTSALHYSPPKFCMG
jgi:hypothetical protein